MADPLSDVIALLQPRTVFTKVISGAGRWGVRYTEFGQPSFCTVIEGSCRLSVDDADPVVLETGDFVLLPATPGFTMSGSEPVTPMLIEPNVADASTDEVRYGAPDSDPDVRLLGGYFIFDSPDAGLLVSMLPPLVHMRGAARLSTLVGIVREEATSHEPGRDLILARLVEVLLVEAIRTVQHEGAPVGLLRGLADARLAPALRLMHSDVAKQWLVADLARETAMSRSSFFDRFTRIVGVTPLEYLLGWRMTVAKDLLRRRETALADIAEHVGYRSASTFSTAFTKHVGLPPGQYARMTPA